MPSEPRLNDDQRLEILRQLSFQYNSGMQIHQCLESLAESRVGDERQVLEMLGRHIVHGRRLSEAMARTGGFSKAVVALTKTGEESGRLHHTLDLCVKWGDRDLRLRRQLRGALLYPLVVAGTAVVVAFVLFRLLVPPFARMLQDMNAEVPWFSRLVFSLSHWLESPFLWIFSLLVLVQAVFWLKNAWQSEKFRRDFSDLAISVPVLGELLKLSAQVRLLLAMNALLVGGAPLLTALKYGLLSTDYPSYSEWGKRAAEQIKQGEQLSYSMRSSDLFSRIPPALIQVGEEAGKMPLTMEKSAVLLSEELDHKLEVFTTLIEPVLLLFSGGLVAVVLASVFLPMYQTIGEL